MRKRRVLEIAGQLFAGDGLTCLLVPTAHMLLWRDALRWRWWRATVQWFADHRGVTRAVGLVEVIGGTWAFLRASRRLG